jgi:hypothetical protein
MKKIFIILLGLSVSIWADFSRDNSTSIVTDNSTGLQWQDDVNITKTWTEAIDYCEALTLGTYSDWRLPNQNELRSIADRTKINPAMDSTFQNVVSYYYWSSNTVVGDEGNAWLVGFSNGDGSWYFKSYSGYGRCVRDGQP